MRCGSAHPTVSASSPIIRSPRGSKLINGYGPTECTIALQHVLRPRSRPRGVTIPIGRPLEGVGVTLADVRPDGCGGEIGEIVLSAEHLAVGYWRDPSRTAQ